MSDSPLAASAYEVLGVAPTVTEDELRRAYRLRLRLSHPDTGGDAAVFVRVQRAWELVGTPHDRAAYDRGRGHGARDGDGRWRPPSPPTGARLRARSYGRPGEWRRERYLAQVRRGAGDAEASSPYDPAFVRTVPRELRRLLADALAEEATARVTDALGMGFTVWHGVAAGTGGDAGIDGAAGIDEGSRLDHLVLGPSGLYGVMSRDFGGVVGFRRGEITGPHIGSRAPVTSLLSRMRAVARVTRVRFGAGIVVLPDDDLAQAVTPLGAPQRTPVIVLRRSALGTVLRTGVPGVPVAGGVQILDIRTRLRQTLRLL